MSRPKKSRAHNLAAAWGDCKFIWGVPSPRKKMLGINTAQTFIARSQKRPVKVQGEQNITLDPITLSSPQRIALLLNVILLPRCFSKTFTDIMFFSLPSYVFTFLFNTYRLLFAVIIIISRLTSCN